jgi:hypothetical protein
VKRKAVCEEENSGAKRRTTAQKGEQQCKKRAVA